MAEGYNKSNRLQTEQKYERNKDKMKEIRTEEAVGHVLCHDITQIIKDEKKACYLKRAM